MCPARKDPDEKIRGGDHHRELYEDDKPVGVFETRTLSGQQRPDHFGEESREERKERPDFRTAGYRPRPETSGKGKQGLESVLVTLPPYVRAYKSGTDTTYVMIVPAGVRPKNWPPSIPLGSDKGQGPGAIREKAWALYGELLHAMHREQLDFERKLHPAGVEDGIDRYKESVKYMKATMAERIHRDKLLKKLKEWVAENAHPPMATITHEHVYAFLMTAGDTHDEQRALKAMLSEVYKAGIRAGYTDHNPTLGLRLPAASGRTMKQVHDMRARLRIFARPLALVPV